MLAEGNSDGFKDNKVNIEDEEAEEAGSNCYHVRSRKMLNFSSFCDSDYSWYKIVNALLILKSIFVISPLSSLLLASVYLDLCG